jgi:hypothetical protein
MPFIVHHPEGFVLLWVLEKDRHVAPSAAAKTTPDQPRRTSEGKNLIPLSS